LKTTAIVLTSCNFCPKDNDFSFANAIKSNPTCMYDKITITHKNKQVSNNHY